MTHAKTMQEGIGLAIERCAKDIAWWVKNSGMEFPAATKMVKGNSTLGTKSWETVIARATELVK